MSSQGVLGRVSIFYSRLTTRLEYFHLAILDKKLILIFNKFNWKYLLPDLNSTLRVPFEPLPLASLQRFRTFMTASRPFLTGLNRYKDHTRSRTRAVFDRMETGSSRNKMMVNLGQNIVHMSCPIHDTNLLFNDSGLGIKNFGSWVDPLIFSKTLNHTCMQLFARLKQNTRQS